MAAVTAQPISGEDGSGVIKCRKCRTQLFSASDIIPHQEGIGQEAFRWHKRSQGGTVSDVPPSPDYISVISPVQPADTKSKGPTGQSLLEVLSLTHQVEYSEKAGGYMITGGEELELVGDNSLSDELEGRVSPKLNSIRASLNSHQCQSLFVEQNQWMESLVLGSSQGKLTCPKCSGRLGSFNWAGLQCSCGQWITPAFQIHKARIDLIAFNISGILSYDINM